MTTATGDFAVNFVPLGDVSPYTNASLTYATADRFQITSNTLKPTAAGIGPAFLWNGAMTAAATIRSKVEVGTAHAGGDQIIALITDATAQNGYALRVNGTGCALSIITAGTFTGLLSGTASTAVSGTVFMLELVQATNTLTCYENGVQIGSMTTTDATHTTGLLFGLLMDPGNSNLSSVLSFAGDGIAVSGSSLLKKMRRYL
jgi:hypothetical protein